MNHEVEPAKPDATGRKAGQAHSWKKSREVEPAKPGVERRKAGQAHLKANLESVVVETGKERDAKENEPSPPAWVTL